MSSRLLEETTVREASCVASSGHDGDLEDDEAGKAGLGVNHYSEDQWVTAPETSEPFRWLGWWLVVIGRWPAEAWIHWWLAAIEMETLGRPLAGGIHSGVVAGSGVESMAGTGM